MDLMVLGWYLDKTLRIYINSKNKKGSGSQITFGPFSLDNYLYVTCRLLEDTSLYNDLMAAELSAEKEQDITNMVDALFELGVLSEVESNDGNKRVFAFESITPEQVDVKVENVFDFIVGSQLLSLIPDSRPGRTALDKKCNFGLLNNLMCSLFTDFCEHTRRKMNPNYPLINLNLHQYASNILRK